MKAPNSRYPALVAINVPTEKARAVVDAMEEDMSTQLATKSDLAVLGSELKQKIDAAGVVHRLEMQQLQYVMTVRLGSIAVAVAGLLFAALKLSP